MPRKLDADWEQAKSLYLKGLSLKTISEQTGIPHGALRQRSVRYKWAIGKTKTDDLVSQAVTEVVARDAKGHVETVISLLGSHLQSLKKRDPDSLDLEEFDAATRILERLNNIGRKTHGLDQEMAQKGNGLVQIVVVNGAQPQFGSVQQAKPIIGDVIDEGLASPNQTTIDVDSGSTS